MGNKIRCGNLTGIKEHAIHIICAINPGLGTSERKIKLIATDINRQAVFLHPDLLFLSLTLFIIYLSKLHLLECDRLLFSFFTREIKALKALKPVSF